jgi:hypothetical protein
MPVIVVLMGRIIALTALENKDLRLTISDLGPCIPQSVNVQVAQVTHLCDDVRTTPTLLNLNGKPERQDFLLKIT